MPNICQLFLVGGNVLKLGRDGGVLVGVALARPAKALTTGKPGKVMLGHSLKEKESEFWDWSPKILFLLHHPCL